VDNNPNIPTIGAAKGLFEILVPGVFLLLNLSWTLYYFQGNVFKNTMIVKIFTDNVVLMVVIIVVMGYLIGVVLWLIGADWLDNACMRLIRLNNYIYLKIYKKPKERETFYQEDFPYLNGLGSISRKYLPPVALNFYNNCWAPWHCKGRNKYFFNYCKTLIYSLDKGSAAEVYANEALIRYIAAMFYALLISLVLLLIVLFTEKIKSCTIPAFLSWAIKSSSSCPLTQVDNSIEIDCIIFIFIYLLSIVVLISHFRYMRFKEVQTVFAASLIHKKEIGNYLSCKSSCSNKTDRTADDRSN